MEAVKLAGLEPAAVFGYFEKLCSIPHGSGNTKAISDYIVGWAQERGIRYEQDALNNVILFGEGTCGYEDHEPVVIQGHIDMVCDRDADCPIDPETDGVDVTHNGEFVYAKGTTLGGDDGIAVAFAMALLDDSTIPHPPLEVVLTVDEETGMDGAAGIDLTRVKGRKMLNIDSDVEGLFTVSCAGGATAVVTLPADKKPVYGPCVRLTVEGLQGGHSGVDINKNRIGANKVMANLLLRIRSLMPFAVVSIQGGSRDNAIARSCQVTAVLLGNDAERINDVAAQLQAELRDYYDEPELVIYGDNVEALGGNALSVETTEKLIALLINIPEGVMEMSKQIEGLVQTSQNMGVVRTEPDCVKITMSVRSSVNAQRQERLDGIAEEAQKRGATMELLGTYPAWEYREESPLRDTMVATYTEMFGKAPRVAAIHAGLECGLLSEKLPGLDCVSMGPNMRDIHTSRERLDIASTQRTWQYLLEVLKRL